MCRDLPRIKYSSVKDAKKDKNGRTIVTEKDEEYRKVERMNNDILERVKRMKAEKLAAAKGVEAGSQEMSLTSFLEEKQN